MIINTFYFVYQLTFFLQRLGESQYTKRMEDIRLLKIEIANLRSQRNLLTRGLANTADMRQEVLQLHRVLTQERVKTKSLEEEMTTPMNIHRLVVTSSYKFKSFFLSILYYYIK